MYMDWNGQYSKIQVCKNVMKNVYGYKSVQILGVDDVKNQSGTYAPMYVVHDY